MEISLTLMLVVLLYWIPSIVAVARHTNVALVAIVNLFFGWTIIGWLIALAMAGTSSKVKEVHHYHDSPTGPPAVGWTKTTETPWSRKKDKPGSTGFCL